MYTFCTKDEWENEYFDSFYYAEERGKFLTYQEARKKAMEYGEQTGESTVVFQID